MKHRITLQFGRSNKTGKIYTIDELKENVEYSEFLDPTTLSIYSRANEYFIFSPKNDPTILYLLNPYSLPKNAVDEITHYNWYVISTKTFGNLCRNKKIKPLIDSGDKDVLFSIYAESWWQALCGMTNPFIKVNSSKGLEDIINAPGNAWNIGEQLGYPIGLGIITGVLRGVYAYKKFQNDYGRPPNAQEWEEIVTDCAAYAAKIAISMGAWELGFFVGQIIISLLHISPFTLWIPVTFCICVGLSQAIVSVANQILDEKRKYGKIKSSTTDLAKIFFNTFIGGVLWQICSYIPFVPLLAQHILKPLADILGNLLLGAATFIILSIANYISTKAFEFVESKVASKNTLFSQDNKTPQTQQVKHFVGSEEHAVKNARYPTVPDVSASTSYLSKKRTTPKKTWSFDAAIECGVLVILVGALSTFLIDAIFSTGMFFGVTSLVIAGTALAPLTPIGFFLLMLFLGGIVTGGVAFCIENRENIFSPKQPLESLKHDGDKMNSAVSFDVNAAENAMSHKSRKEKNIFHKKRPEFISPDSSNFDKDSYENIHNKKNS